MALVALAYKEGEGSVHTMALVALAGAWHCGAAHVRATSVQPRKCCMLGHATATWFATGRPVGSGMH